LFILLAYAIIFQLFSGGNFYWGAYSSMTCHNTSHQHKIWFMAAVEMLW